MGPKARKRSPRTGDFIRSSVYTGIALGFMVLVFSLVFFEHHHGEWNINSAAILGMMAVFVWLYYRDFRKEFREHRKATQGRLR